MSRVSMASKFTETVLDNQGAVVALLGKPQTCDNCRRRITANKPTIVWLEQSQKICPACALLFLKQGALLSRVVELLPPCGHGDTALLSIMKNSPLGELAIIPYASEMFGPSDPWNSGIHNQIALSETMRAVFMMLFKSVVHRGEGLRDELIPLLASSVLRDLLNKHPWLAEQVDQLVCTADRDTQLGILQMLPSFTWKRFDKLRLISKIKQGDDSAIAEAIATNLSKIGIHNTADFENALRYHPGAELMMHSCKPETIRAMHSFIFRFIPGNSGTKKCSALAFEIVKALSEPADIERFYQALPDPIQKLIQLLLWRRTPPDSDEIENATGLRTVSLADIRSWRNNFYSEVKKEYRGLLTLLELDDQRAGVMIVSWLDQQFKKVLPKPTEVTLGGSGNPLNMPGREILRFNPDFVALLPNLYARLRDGSIKLKKNGLPTIAGCRQMVTGGGDYTEFYPEDRVLRSLRSELLFRMLNQIEISSDEALTAPLVVRALLDSFFNPPSESEINPTLVYNLLTHLDWGYHGIDKKLEFECLCSMRHLMTTLPKNRWVTIDQALDYLYLNNRGLGSSMNAKMPQAVVESQWRTRNYIFLNQANVSYYWEEPLLKTFIMLLASLNAVEILYGKPRNSGRCVYNKPYLSRADGVSAFRLSPLGEWYFQDGDESCFKKLERGRIMLDQNRLLLQLQGEDIALKTSLDQIARVIGNNFYSVESASFLKDCRTEEAVFQKINAFRALLPDELPQVWQNFFETTNAKLNPLQPVTDKYTVLKLEDNPELRQLLVSNRRLRMLSTLAEGGLILVSHKDLRLFKKALADLGFFVSGF